VTHRVLQPRRDAVDEFQARRVGVVAGTDVGPEELDRHCARRRRRRWHRRDVCAAGGAARRLRLALQPVPDARVVEGVAAALHFRHRVVAGEEPSQADAAPVVVVIVAAVPHRPCGGAVAVRGALRGIRRRRRRRLLGLDLSPDDRNAPESPGKRRRRCRIPSPVVNALSVLDLVQGARSTVPGEHGGGGGWHEQCRGEAGRKGGSTAHPQQQVEKWILLLVVVRRKVPEIASRETGGQAFTSRQFEVSASVLFVLQCRSSSV
jgi:hypothetical protein